MNKYVVWLFLAGLLFGQTNSYIVPKKQKELPEVFVEAQTKDLQEKARPHIYSFCR